MPIWIKIVLESLAKKEFTGKIVLNFTKGNLCRKYEIRKSEVGG